MALFKNPTLMDIVIYVDAVKRGDQVQENRSDKLIHSSKADLVIIDALRVFGATFRKKADHDRLVTLVDKFSLKVDPPHAREALRQLGIAFFATPEINAGIDLMLQQAKDPALTRIERNLGLRSLLFTAGMMARSLDLDLLVRK